MMSLNVAKCQQPGIQPQSWWSNGEKMLPVWLERSYRLTAVAYKDVFKTKVFPWSKKITKKSNYILQQDGELAHTAKAIQNWLGASMRLGPKEFWPSDFGRTLRNSLARHTTAPQMSSRLLWTPRGSQWRNILSEKSSRVIYIVMLCYKSCFISLKIT